MFKQHNAFLFSQQNSFFVNLSFSGKLFFFDPQKWNLLLSNEENEGLLVKDVQLGFKKIDTFQKFDIFVLIMGLVSFSDEVDFVGNF